MITTGIVRLLTVVFTTVGYTSLISAQDEPTVEFRALFIATVENIDWPRSAADPVSVQRADLVDYISLMDSLNMNAVMFQARTTGDALYNSPIEPWSKYMTGTQGTPPDPIWDPMQVLVDEAHQRNIEVHVWVNPYRANMEPNWNGLAPNHMANVLRQYAYPYSSYLWMDPGVPEVVDHLLNVIGDIVTRYNVDGIHMDDYFYPYPVATPFPDHETYARYQEQGGPLSLEDWRRANVNVMITRVLNLIKTTRPSCKFSISPFGLYRPGHAEGMPPPITGFDPYSEIYADSKLWLQQGWMDMFAPQLYWAINSTGQSYPTLLDWWLTQNPIRKHIYVANGVYRVDVSQSNWPVQEIVDQITISRDVGRRNQLSLGNILFSAKYFRDNTKGISDIFRSSVYTHKATVPPIS